MKKWLLIILIVGMVSWAAYQYFDSSDEETTVEAPKESEDIGLSIGQTAPDFSITTLDGDKKQLSEFR